MSVLPTSGAMIAPMPTMTGMVIVGEGASLSFHGNESGCHVIEQCIDHFPPGRK